MPHCACGSFKAAVPTVFQQRWLHHHHILVQNVE
jgi:hypothetical protein